MTMKAVMEWISPRLGYPADRVFCQCGNPSAANIAHGAFHCFPLNVVGMDLTEKPLRCSCGTYVLESRESRRSGEDGVHGVDRCGDLRDLQVTEPVPYAGSWLDDLDNHIEELQAAAHDFSWTPPDERERPAARLKLAKGRLRKFVMERIK